MHWQCQAHLHLWGLWVHPCCNWGPYLPVALPNTGPVLYVQTINPPTPQADHIQPLCYCATPIIHSHDHCSWWSHLYSQHLRSTGIWVPCGVLSVDDHLVAVYGHLMCDDGGQVHLGKSGKGGVGGCSRGWFHEFIEVSSCTVGCQQTIYLLTTTYHILHQWYNSIQQSADIIHQIFDPAVSLLQ